MIARTFLGLLLPFAAGKIDIPIEYEREFEQQMDALQVALRAWKQSEAGRYALQNGFYTEDTYEAMDIDQLGRFFMSQIAVKKAQASNPNAIFSIDTPFSLMTEEEFAQFVGSSYDVQARRSLQTSNATRMTTPSSIDWTTSGCLTPPKNQGMCGSCWAFAAIGALESALCLQRKNETLTLYSEQQVNDCDTKSYGCSGGFPRNALEYIQQNKGVCTAEAYPYVSGDSGKNGKCIEKSCGEMDIRVNSVGSSEDAFVRALAAQPIAVGVAAGNREWKQYKAGILSTCSTDELDHAVLAVGYGTGSDGDFFKIKNSWGTGWGDKGFMYLKRDEDESACGIINEHAVYPTIL
ncbi:hypothetical protein ABG067_007064 [Albugo candida]